MWCLQELNRRNAEITDGYFTTVPPRARLRSRLRALELTTPKQTAAIMPVFDATPADDAERVANLDVAELVALAGPIAARRKTRESVRLRS